MPWLAQLWPVLSESNSDDCEMGTGGSEARREQSGYRFFYENEKVFTSSQLRQIKKITMARILCDAGEHFSFVPLMAFNTFKSGRDELLRYTEKAEDEINTFRCDEIADIDYTDWKEELSI